MSTASVTVLDVGHGNCTLIQAGAHVAVVDAPEKTSLLQYLLENSIRRLDYLLVSHADADHISGLVSLLVDGRWQVGSVYINPDQIRRTRTWDQFKMAIYHARRSGTSVHSTLTNVDPGVLHVGDIALEVIAPSPVLAISGPESRLGATTLGANTLSAVLRVAMAGIGHVLLPADLDATGLEFLVDDLTTAGRHLDAAVLVFPHHGGHSGTRDLTTFAARLCALVHPNEVIFSIGRGRYGTPRPEIVRALRAATPNIRIACTELSTRCSPTATANGAAKRRYPCAGTIRISLPSGNWERPSRDAHAAFVNSGVEHPLCLETDGVDRGAVE